MRSIIERRQMVNQTDTSLSIVKQCKLLNIHRSGVYYKPCGESDLNIELMRLMDEHYLKHPYKGARRMHVWLTKDKGYKVSLNRVERLYYRVMGLRAVMPGPHTSKRNKDHAVYPYLLRNMSITHANQVWAMDITYIPMKKGYMYLVAVIDIYSRMVLNWSLSNTMEAQWCKEVFEEALIQYGRPEIINTDQGVQFTSTVFTKYVQSEGIKLSMDGKGRATDNAYIERFWRSLKYEHIYLYPKENTLDLYKGISKYIQEYNEERRHSSIDNQRPKEVFEKTLKVAA